MMAKGIASMTNKNTCLMFELQTEKSNFKGLGRQHFKLT